MHRFFQWLRQVFWYYNKWIIVVAAVLALMVAWLVADSARMGKADLDIILMTAYRPDESLIESYQNTISEFIDDKNNDGRIIVRISYLYLGEDATEKERMEYAGTLVDRDLVMYLTDSETGLRSGIEQSASVYPSSVLKGEKDFYNELNPDMFPSEWGATYAIFRTKPSSSKKTDAEYYGVYIDLMRNIGIK